jgi:hypothetical protein
MKDIIGITDSVAMNMIRKRGGDDLFSMFGKFNVEHWRGGKLLNVYDVLNAITNEGKNKIFNVMFRDATQIAAASWYIGLVSTSGFSAFAAADTMASHTGWTEFTSYSQSNRVAWGAVDSTAQSITNTTPATFSITGSGTLQGMFLVSNNTKGGTTGVLWNGSSFSATVPVVNGDEIKVTYTVNA